MKTYVGIDPGKTGCVAVILDNRVEFYDAEVNIAQLGSRIAGLNIFVLLEKVQVMPGSVKRRFDAGAAAGMEGEQKEVRQGGVSILNYGINYGEYLGMLKAHRIPYGEIYSQSWKREFGLFALRDRRGERLPLREVKQRSIEMAKRLFPSVADRLTLQKHHGRAEALLIAEYARRRNM